MTKILLLDTATRSATLALGSPAERRFVRSDPSERNSRDLMALVRELCAPSGGLSHVSLDAVGFNRGPGSYTGSRLAASVVQGIAYVKQCPVIELNTLELLYLSGLDALAQSTAENATLNHTLVAVESKVGEYFWTTFTLGKSTYAPTIRVGDAAELKASIQAENAQVMLNSTMQTHQDLLDIDCVLWVQPRVELAFDIAAQRLDQGCVVDALNVEPLYGQDNIGWLTLAQQRAQQ